MRIGWRGKLRLGLLLAFAGLQWLPYPRPESGPVHDQPPLPQDLSSWFQERCYDCHSHQTRWPWYSRIAPLSWWFADEVRRGQAAVNFSRWSSYTPRQRRLALRRSLERIREDLMPPVSYRLVHPNGFDEQEVRRLENFVQQQEAAGALDMLPEELLAWPWPTHNTLPKGPLRGVHRIEGRVHQRLVLQQGLVLASGNVTLEAGVEGQGAVLVGGSLTLKGPGPGPEVMLVGLAGVSPAPSSPPLHFCMLVPGIRELRLEYCRDDGELGERLERQIVLRQSVSGGPLVLWDPEYQRVERAASIDEALNSMERMLSADPATSLSRWKRRFRKHWKQRLQHWMTDMSAAPAFLELDRNPYPARKPPK